MRRGMWVEVVVKANDRSPERERERAEGLNESGCEGITPTKAHPEALNIEWGIKNRFQKLSLSSFSLTSSSPSSP